MCPVITPTVISGNVFLCRCDPGYDSDVNASALSQDTLLRLEDAGRTFRMGEVEVAALAGVKLGLINDERAQVVEGLAPDEAVIAEPSREITAGLRVAVEQ